MLLTLFLLTVISKLNVLVNSYIQTECGNVGMTYLKVTITQGHQLIKSRPIDHLACKDYRVPVWSWFCRRLQCGWQWSHDVTQTSPCPAPSSPAASSAERSAAPSGESRFSLPIASRWNG